MLDVTSDLEFDNTVSREQYRHLAPYNVSSLGPGDEIRIPINQQDAHTFPHKSFIYLEGQLINISNGNPIKGAKFSNNALAFLFEEVRLEVAGVEIDRTRNVGVSSTIKTYVSCGAAKTKYLQAAGWDRAPILDNEGNFTAVIPLSSLLGFAEDFDKILVNVKLELVLIRARNEADLFQDGSDYWKVKIKLNKVLWRMPFIEVSSEERLRLAKIVKEDKGLYLPFRSWDLYEYPELPQSTKHTWTVKTTTELEKPRYVIVAFQTDRRNNVLKSSSEFDTCDLRSLKLYLNSDVYPYENLNVDFSKNAYSVLYNMYADFGASFYKVDDVQPILDYEHFKTLAPLVVIDCSKQMENLKKGGPVDIRLEIETRTSVPQKTTMFCMIVHDKIMKYYPLSNTVEKM